MPYLYRRIYTALVMKGYTHSDAVHLLRAACRGNRLALIEIRTTVQLMRRLIRMDFMIEELVDHEKIVG